MVNCLYSEVRPFLLLARVCGLLPLYNIKKLEFSQIRLKWISLLTCYWLLLWVLSLQVFAWSAYFTIMGDESAVTTVSSIKLLVQLGPPVLITPAFLYISVNCARFLEAWAEVERALPPLSCNIRWRLWLIAKTIVVGQLVHHLLMDVSEIETKHRCVKSSLWLAIHLQYNIKYPFLFFGACFPSASRIVISLAYQLIMDLQWACGPVLIITVSRMLDWWLDSLNSKLEHYRDQVMPTRYWQTMREKYNSISRLTRIANNLLHPAILVCCLTETVFIILFIYMTLNFQWRNQVFGAISAALTYHSYVNLELLLSMSAIPELSRRPLTVLTSVPTVVYNQEVSRFYDQVVYDHLALTGGTLFVISRTLIVKVVSSLITYEVVLMQEHPFMVEEVTSASLNSTSSSQDYCLGTILPMFHVLSRNNAHGV